MKSKAMHNNFIKIQAVENCNSIDELIVNGSYKVTFNENGIKVNGAKILNHIVMVITRTYDGHTAVPFKKANKPRVGPTQVIEYKQYRISFQLYRVFKYHI